MKRRPNEDHSCKNGHLDDQGRLKKTHLVTLILGNWTLEKWDDEKVEIWESWILGKWDFGKVGFWGSWILGKLDFAKAGFWESGKWHFLEYEICKSVFRSN